MSQENVERLRRIYEGFNAGRRDSGVLAADVEFMQPDELGGGRGVYYGVEGFDRGLRELTETFDDFHIEPERFIDAGDRVVAFVRLQGRARQSGVPVDAAFAHVVAFRSGLVVKWHAYAHRGEALNAVGLSEEDTHTGSS